MAYTAKTKRAAASNGRNAKSKYKVTNAKKKILKAENSGTNQIMKPKQMDYAILLTVIILVIFGLVMVFSSSYYYAMTHVVFNDKFYFVKRQAMWACIGFGAMFFLAFFDYRILKKFVPYIYIGTILLLVLVLFMGDEANGSTRSIFGFQPSEFTKIVIILTMANFLEKYPNAVRTPLGFIISLGIIGIPAALIALENLSTAIVVAGIGMVLVFVAGVKFIYLFFIGFLGIGAGAALVLPKPFRYRLKRLESWLDPFAYISDGGYQTVQSLYAIASGGIFGRGLGNSIQKLGYIPEAYNDIIFSVICEELGLFGAGVLILLFIILIWRGIRVATRAKERFGALVAAGITSMVAIQAIVNIAVATNTFPNTGMALPFISYGGSSLCMLLASMGVLLNISCYTK